tara:strand:- start:533 stop:640 length:108 start_codon:yes stop_codon:yes gene_type:complete
VVVLEDQHNIMELVEVVLAVIEHQDMVLLLYKVVH